MLFIFNLRKQGEVGVTVQERFEYDSQNRLVKHYHQVDNNPEELLAENTYNDLSQLVNKKVGSTSGSAPLQSIDYDYNIRGWMTEINKNQMAATDLGGKLFSYKIKYTSREGIENPDTAQFSGKNVVPKYNGNITEVDWRAVESIGAYPSTTPKRYGYAYDKINRLTAGFYQNPQNPYSKENIESLVYDLNGNISNLYRTSVMENGSSTATVIDNLTYDYTGNRATKIKDISGNSTGYEGTAGNTIGYDVNGNMKNMIDKSITAIGYNYLNLPNSLTINLGQLTTDIATKYRADGSKVRKETTKISIGVIGTTTTKETTDYLDGFQYFSTTGGNTGGGGSTEMMMASRAFEPQAFSLVDPTGTSTLLTIKTPDLQFFPTAEGFYDYIKNQYIYQYKDLQGNVRLSYARNSAGALEIVDNNDFYPFGMNHLKTGNAYFGGGSYKNYKYQEQELQETGFYSFKWRNYMPDVGRFFNIDVLAEDYDYQTPYAFSENKVTNHIELEGLEAVPIGPGGVPIAPPPPAYGSSTTGFHPVGAGAWSELKGRLINTWNFSVKHAGINYGIITTGVSVAAQRVLNSEGDSKKEEKKTRLENNKTKGKKAEKEVTKDLEDEFPEDDVLTQVTGKFKDGSKTVFDDVIVDGKTGKVKGTNETKTGDAKLTKQQKRYRDGETVELTGKRAGDAKGEKINVNKVPDRTTRR